MDELYIEIEINTSNGETDIYTSVPSFLALYVYRYLNAPANIKLNFVRTTLATSTGKLKLRTEQLRRELSEAIICKSGTTVSAIRDLLLPIYERDGNTYIAGTCAVCRELIARQPNADLHKLLGFKNSCLLAPAEASIWTRFCEVDVVTVVNRLLCGEELTQVPVEVVRFEQHMNEPVRMHNIYKEARELANQTENGEKVKRKDRVIIECSVPKEELLLEHRFAEGVNFNIADILLYPMFRIIMQHCKKMLPNFPLTCTWLDEVETFEPKCVRLLNDLYGMNCNEVNSVRDLCIPDCKATSLYKADPKRYKPKNRIYTTQSEVNAALEKLQMLKLDYTSDATESFGEEIIDWSTIEPQHARSSALPKERLVRKRQQLENMANAVVSLAKTGERIIDFCSGTGHLAILLALKLPLCTVIIMENKAYSLAQARKRAAELNLNNCRFYQCNIDYFVGDFEIGASLHACGTATDIVLQQCLRAHACFVCCPCCYGSLQPMPHIQYPLSKCFRNVLDVENYLYIAHTADQAHELGVTDCKPEISRQGKHCMCVIDTDRKLQAEESGYKVILTRLKPEECTPKNHLLVGRFVGNS